MRQRQLEEHARTAAWCSFGANAAPVHRDELSHDREPDPAAARRRLGFAIEPDVRLPDALPLLVRNAGTLILDVDARAIADDLRADGDRLSRRSVLHGVV